MNIKTKNLKREEYVLNNLNLFNTTGYQQQKNIFKKIILNDLRGIKDSNIRKKFLEIYRQRDKSHKYHYKKTHKLANIFNNLVKITQENGEPYISSLLQNIYLYDNDITPIFHYCFNCWYEIKDKNDYQIFLDLLEISIHYAFRQIKINIDIDPKFLIIGQGAYNKIFLDKESKNILKVPINYGAVAYINDSEYQRTILLEKTDIKEFIVKSVEINQDNKIIYKSYIEGESGDYYLRNNFPLANDKIRSLKRFFNNYQKLNTQTNIFLDIHPGNFIWNKEKTKWIIIDLGPIPNIGSDYFPLDSFDNYFQKIWLSRARLIKEEPIRSVMF